MYNDKLSKSIAEAAKKCMDEELKGQQHKLDVNKNNKIDAEDLKHLRAGKKPVAEASKADVPAYLRKQKGEAPLTVADVKAPRKDSISHKDNLAKLRNEEQEQIQEYESKGGVYKHQGTYGRAKDSEAGETDWKKEEMGEPKEKKSRKLGARQNFVRSKRVNEGFSAMLDTFEEKGIKGLYEAWAKKKVMKEEPTNDEYTTELEKQKAKAAGTAPQADVAKAAVQAVQQEETHTQIQVVDMTDPNNIQNETIDLEERTLTAGETKKKEEIVKSMKKGIEGFKERYGSRAKEVMYATATKQAKKD